MATPQPVIQTIKELTTINTTGQTMRSYNVSFMVGSQGPFTLTIPGSQFNAKEVQARVKTFAAEIQALVPGE